MQAFERAQRNQSVFNHPNSQTCIIGGAHSPIKFVQRLVKIMPSPINNGDAFELPESEIPKINQALTMKHINEEFQYQYSIDFCDLFKKFEFISMNQGIVKLQRPFVNGRSLSEVIMSNGPQSNIIASLHVARIVISIVEQMHNKGFVLKNLKPENVFLSDGKLYLVDCFFDFMYEETLLNTNSMIPLLFRGPEGSDKPSRELDIFHFGLLCYLLCFGRLPWVSMNHGRIYNDMMRESIPFPDMEYGPNTNLNYSLTVEIIRKCFKANPSKRPTASEIHAMICDVINNSDESSSDILRSIKHPINHMSVQQGLPNRRAIRTATSYLSNVVMNNNILLNSEDNKNGKSLNFIEENSNNNSNNFYVNSNSNSFDNNNNNNNSNNNNSNINVNTNIGPNTKNQLGQPKKALCIIRSNAALPPITTIVPNHENGNFDKNNICNNKGIGNSANMKKTQILNSKSSTNVGTLSDFVLNHKEKQNNLSCDFSIQGSTNMQLQQRPTQGIIDHKRYKSLNNIEQQECLQMFEDHSSLSPNLNMVNDSHMNNLQMNSLQMNNSHISNSQMNKLHMNSPQMSSIQFGNPQMGNPQMGNQQMGNPQMGNQQMGNPQMGNPQMGNPQMGNPQMGNPQMGNPQVSFEKDSNTDSSREKRNRSNSNCFMLNMGIVNTGANKKVVNNNVNVNQLRVCKRMSCSTINFMSENKNIT